jgi:mannosyl-oligosaccharide glucosidase
VDGDLRLTTSWVKSINKQKKNEEGFGGDFAIRVQTERITKKEDTSKEEGDTVCLIFYVLDESLVLGGSSSSRGGASLSVGANHEDRHEGGAIRRQLVSGFRQEDAKQWAVHLRGGEEEGNNLSWTYVTEDIRHVHNLTDFAKVQLYSSGLGVSVPTKNGRSVKIPVLKNSGAHSGQPNLAMFQLVLPVGPNGQVDLVFNSGLKKVDHYNHPKGSRFEDTYSSGFEDMEKKVEGLSGGALTAKFERKREEFDQKFDRVFPIHGDAEAKKVAKSAVSNLVGSIGYFVGNVLISNKNSNEFLCHYVSRKFCSVVQYDTRALFTACPSRSFFPRGFLWDEGFHQLVIQKWKGDLSREMMASWFDLMNVNGWIPREAILGQEALARVPAEFVHQHPSHANPPSMLIPLHKMATDLKKEEGEATTMNKKKDEEFIREIYPRLRTWFEWFLRTQKGPAPLSFRWKGRDGTTNRELNPKTLSSGLDDYPRASHPTDKERHLDLRCWMALGARTMAEIAEIAGAPASEMQEYSELASSLRNESILDGLHYDEDSGMYFDWGYHTDTVDLFRTVDQFGNQHIFRKVGEKLPTTQLVREFGYVSLFPLMMKLIDPNSDKLGKHLELLRDESLLWTPYGLRSLATTSKYYNKYNTQHDKPYWRSPIWINVNYLVLDALEHYARHQRGPYSEKANELFQELRSSVMGNIVDQYTKSGFLWENYSDADGKGTGSHPFTGWTALFVLIASNSS